jgi:HMG (high mobility group) box
MPFIFVCPISIEQPRRPLSAYNLFFSEERERILKEIAKKEGKSDTSEGEEGEHEAVVDEVESERDCDDGEKPRALLQPLIPAEKKRRPHRKTHGKISFQQLAKMVGERWKGLPDDERKYYQDLAQQDMKRQKVAMEEYYAKQNTATYATGDVKSEIKDAPGPTENTFSGEGNTEV